MSEWLYECVVPGSPIGKGRAKGTAVGGYVRMYTPKKTADWERSSAVVMSSYWQDAPIDDPVEVEIISLAPRPKRLLRKKDPDGVLLKPSKPDSDNICKSVLDALVMAGVLRDDSLVVHHEVWDLYSERDRGPKIAVRLRVASSVPVDDWWNRVSQTLVTVFRVGAKSDLPW
jgi:Holliday junction resolvase RusA-like endonuclease